MQLTAITSSRDLAELLNQEVVNQELKKQGKFALPFLFSLIRRIIASETNLSLAENRYRWLLFSQLIQDHPIASALCNR
jgi:hypothetical protein